MKTGFVTRPAVLAGLFGCLLLTLAVNSTPRVVGDGAEYVRMADRLASGHLPGAGESRHFLFYAALASPLVKLAGALGLDPLRGFTLLNALLLGVAFYVAASRLHWTWCAIVFGGPILWWLDKPHTEPFTFALYAIAFSLIESAPWWSFLALGAAATQNPGNAALVPILAVAAVAGKTALLRDRRFWLGLGAGAAVAALHPAYYLIRMGTPTRLASAGDVHWVTLPEYVAVLLDPNIGLAPHAPIYAAAVLVGALALAVRAPRRLLSPGVAAAVASAAWLAFVAATATNVNHGGTPGLSRYATWFIPLAIPLFQELDRVFARSRAWMTIPALVSAVTGLWIYHPVRAEAAGRPTRLAWFLWTEHPSMDNPLPEIFAERLRGLDENWLPVATPGCEKILLPGRGGRDSVWPMPCAPAALPDRCQAPGAVCYANRTRTGYEFVSPRVSNPQAFRLARSAAWPPSAERRVREALTSLRWWDMRVQRAGEPGTFILSSNHVGHVFTWQGTDRLFVFAIDVQPGAELIAQVPKAMSGSFTVESGPAEGPRVELKPGAGGQAVRLPSPQPWVMFTAESR